MSALFQKGFKVSLGTVGDINYSSGTDFDISEIASPVPREFPWAPGIGH